MREQGDIDRSGASALLLRANEPYTGSPSARDWLFFALQVALVVCVELSDDVVHLLTGRNNAQQGVLDALRMVQFERLHGLWIEPALQSFFERTHHVLGHAIGWMQVVPLFDTVYGPCHVLVTLTFALWVYLRRRHLFAFLRNVFLLTNGLAVLLYEVFPMAPPRLTPGLHFHGHAYQFQDAVFGAASGLRIGFNEFAAMPSVHVAWALIVGLSLAYSARLFVVRLLGLLWPLLMILTVVVTGNHYVTDALGAVLVLCCATLLALVVERYGRSRRLASTHSTPVAA